MEMINLKTEISTELSVVRGVNIAGTKINSDSNQNGNKFNDLLSNLNNSVNLEQIDTSNTEEAINYEMIIALLINFINQENNIDLQQLNESISNMDTTSLLHQLEGIDGFEIEKLEELVEYLNTENFNDSNNNTNKDKFTLLESIAKINDSHYNKTINENESLDVNGMLNKNSLDEIYENQNNDLGILENIADVSENNFSFQVNNLEREVLTEEVKMPTIIKQEFIEEETIKTLKFMTKNGVEEITVKISPRELGDMTIKLLKESDATTVLIELTNDDAYELVNRNLNELIKNLEDSKMNIKDIIININKDEKDLNGQNFSNEFNKKQQEQKNKKNSLDIESVEFEENIQNIEENLDILI